MSGVVRHTMRALPLTSMHNTTRDYSAMGNSFDCLRLRTLCMALLLVFAHAVFATSAFSQAQSQNAPRAASAGDEKTEDARTGAGVTTRTNVTETLIDESIPDDPAILKVLEPYRAPVRELNVIIGRLEGDLRKGRVGAGSLGNFVTDSLRNAARRKLGQPVVLMVTNSGGMRKSSIAAGDLRVRDIFELVPFENKLIRVDLTGEQVLTILKAVVADRDAQSGAHVTFRYSTDNKPEIIGAKLIGTHGREYNINPKTIYRVVTIDYLYNLKSGNYSILRESKNVAPLGITLRDALLDYVKSETAKGHLIRSKLDNRFTQIGPTPKETEPQ